MLKFSHHGHSVVRWGWHYYCVISPRLTHSIPVALSGVNWVGRALFWEVWHNNYLGQWKQGTDPACRNVTITGKWLKSSLNNQWFQDQWVKTELRSSLSCPLPFTLLLPLNYLPPHYPAPTGMIILIAIMLGARNDRVLPMCQAHSCIISFNPHKSLLRKELFFFFF